MTTGEKLANLRKENNYTQENLADILNVSRQAISRWEGDLAFPETEKLIKLASLYGCSVDYLLNNLNNQYEIKKYFEYKSKLIIKGIPLIHVSLSRKEWACGIIALGIKARGVLSCGIISVGAISFGVISAGLFSLGIIALGIIAIAAISIGIYAVGAIAIGVIAIGAIAIGYISCGAISVGKALSYGYISYGDIAVGIKSYRGDIALSKSNLNKSTGLFQNDMTNKENIISTFRGLFKTFVKALLSNK